VGDLGGRGAGAVRVPARVRDLVQAVHVGGAAGRGAEGEGAIGGGEDTLVDELAAEADGRRGRWGGEERGFRFDEEGAAIGETDGRARGAGGDE
jgi:hypothetical protein